MARIGLLVLREGTWNGTPVVRCDWARRIVTPVTSIGAAGPFLTVMPALDLVISHKTQPGGASVSRPQYLALVDQLVQARCTSQEAP